METLNRAGITEKLSASYYLGSGVTGLVPFEVIATKSLDEGSKLPSSFEVVRDSHSSSLFLASSETHKKPGDDSVLFILKDDSGQSQIEVVSPDLFIINGPIDSEGFQDRLPYLFYNLAERARQEKFELLTAHAAAVSKDGRGILILGDKGSGKTSIMLALCLTQGYEMVGNDSVILGTQRELSVMAGSRQINVRLPVAKKLSLPLNEELRKEDQIDYEIKSSFLPEDLGIKANESSNPISMVVRINLHSDNPDFVATNIPSLEIEALRLSENFSRYIRGIPTPLELSSTGIRGYFPDLDSPELTETRNNVVNALLTQTTYLYVAGNDPTHTAQQLDAIIKKL
ncbi:hypothetical protein A2630_00670 [Candidatus Woesebacteria bacterium RIFCSPHIGHO2_01_FULL_44_10]|uniref:HPr kinase/phosphorylase C-terminal domain-containing protein n=1 Tax=Candidatus Woesebacteria bacterium RIFCSPLOWO2_01_FULL_44_14 TaxID=1802525 RepID=A0A1F8C1Q3_9BACT|nr:MAG: hypothetical protein A2630_00670 [Candidatus Woesebacteria bacterium RIFCSPHIGHO2_01_FULL_44_10]OGM54365.1 MAG: hypothetical protein A3F62_01260 [Candidatus Woesebacteria bacterium RIFCSPHIGHO2_12_FULL_44_11]OGM70266.1 MAG: hypothetical protein A2975_04305 [Candidatus Woesebacteria bacterium RIFCSPLOWO2_01_FULL_44_14]